MRCDIWNYFDKKAPTTMFIIEFHSYCDDNKTKIPSITQRQKKNI